jgi:predicted glycoside hydrolase/deacetylase ChbG (UPF0249 family)
MVALHEEALLLATDFNTAASGDSTGVHSKLVHRFLLELSRWMGNPPHLDKHQSVDDYQQIQILNNELVNTHRRLEKANAQLNRLNEELHNRLVSVPVGDRAAYRHGSQSLGLVRFHRYRQLQINQ